MELDARNVPPD